MSAWKAIIGAPGYEVSDDGFVRSWLGMGRAAGTRSASPRLLRLQSNGRGYRVVYPKGDNGKVTLLVHRLVLEAFVGPCPDGHEASHLNGDRGDNRLANLAWETASENNRRKAEHGTRKTRAKLTETDVAAIRASPDPRLVLAVRYGVTPSAIGLILRGETWKSVPCP
jgi:hypothetical protein